MEKKILKNVKKQLKQLKNNFSADKEFLFF